jgi:hypothetical protein
MAEEVRKGELGNANVHVVKASDIITTEANIKVRLNIWFLLLIR